MEIFNPKYVQCVWDDSLKGKEVFYDDTVGELEYEVQNLPHYKGKVIGHSEDTDKPFTVKGVCNNFTNWRYVYHDPNFDVKVAYYRDGKQVQFKSKVDGTWGNCGEEPAWDDGYEYRIKPDEPEKNVVTAAEFPNLCGYCIHRKDGCMPEPVGNCVNFFSTNDDYFRVKQIYLNLLDEHVKLACKYDDLVSGIQNLIHKPVNC